MFISFQERQLAIVQQETMNIPLHIIVIHRRLSILSDTKNHTGLSILYTCT